MGADSRSAARASESMPHAPATAVLANVVWPGLLLEERMLTFWAIGLGLLVEVAFVRWMFASSVGKAALAALAANAASTLVGVLAVPLVGLFLSFSMLLTFAGACLANAAIESVVYRNGLRFRVRKREVLLLALANAVSAGVALASLLLGPGR